uniref:Golgin subfamily A member 1 n=1 Tax=Nothobranchius furzeri TaxID=105023 RepID=A0A8C6LWL1_NOTFU
MFAKLKKKIAEEAATAPRSGVRIPRTISKESITSVGADSGDDFASDGSSSRDDLSAQLLRRNHQIRKLEAKLSDYAEQLRIMQKTKEKLEIALERHQDSSIKKLQEQSESHQANRTKMAEGMAVALEKKDQEWMEKLAALEREKSALSAQLEEMMKQSLTLFQKRDDLDELDGFQQQELAKVKHMVSYCLVWCLSRQAAVTEEDKERLLVEFQKKVSSLERRLQGNLSQDEHLQELLQEKSSLEMSLENTRAELLSVRTNHADTVSSLEAQVKHVDVATNLYSSGRTHTVLWTLMMSLSFVSKKLKPEVEAEGKEKPEPVCPEPPSTPAPSPPTSRTTVTNTSDLNDSREINFEYLKHVVLKFMSSRDAEAYQLIRAVSVLLSFTREEEEMLKQTLEYKMSWFGSKPSPKGIIRPSISGASTHWS